MPSTGFFAPRRRRLLWAALLITLLALPLLWRLFGPRGIEVQALRKTWRFEIDIERRILETGSDWCDALPATARDVQRRLLSDPSGQRSAPAEHCRYSEPQWRALRMVRAAGEAPTVPHWPAPKLNEQTDGDGLGAERLGPRRAIYEVELAALHTDQRWTCRLLPAHWQALALGRPMRLRIDRQGVADCSSLPQ